MGVGSKKLECGFRRIYAGGPSSLGFGFEGLSFSTVPGPSEHDMAQLRSIH